MAITTMSSRDFNQDRGQAKKAARNGPVVITDRGRPSLVLLTYDDYTKLTAGAASVIDLLAMPNAELVEFDPPQAADIFTPVDLS